MDKAKPSPGIFADLAAGLWGVWVEMWKAFWAIFPTAISFILWILVGIIIVPCVFIAGHIYPMWQEWGEGF